MSKEVVFTMKLESELRAEFIAEAEAAHRPASQVLCELMREFVQRQREAREYDEFLDSKVKVARLSMRAGRGRSNDEVEAEFAARRRDLRANRKLAARAGLHQADAFDAAHFRSLSPLAPAHVHFGVVDAERLDLDDNVPGFRLRLWNVLVDQAVEPTEFIENDRAHSGSPSSERPPPSSRCGH